MHTNEKKPIAPQAALLLTFWRAASRFRANPLYHWAGA
jgi:hypothetical protein|tara:strand:- start:1917 stop:2030 length:114 start_codon:yes stop_codon:yes gene_type:complete